MNRADSPANADWKDISSALRLGAKQLTADAKALKRQDDNSKNGDSDAHDASLLDDMLIRAEEMTDIAHRLEDLKSRLPSSVAPRSQVKGQER